MDEQYPDVMLDIETGGLDPSRNPILSISAVKFNARTFAVSPHFFSANLMPVPNRYWDEGTREWWMKRKSVLQDMLSNARPAKDVLVDLMNWAGSLQLSMWAMPTHFDHSFVQRLYADFGMQIPFHYRSARDLNSFIDGLFYPEKAPTADIWASLSERTGDAHNALDDTLHQLRYLFQAITMAKASKQEN